MTYPVLPRVPTISRKPDPRFWSTESKGMLDPCSAKEASKTRRNRWITHRTLVFTADSDIECRYPSIQVYVRSSRGDLSGRWNRDVCRIQPRVSFRLRMPNEAIESRNVKRPPLHPD